jgi:hypothetical protein
MSLTQERPSGAWTGVQYILKTGLVNDFAYIFDPTLLTSSSTDRSYKQYLAVAPFPSKSHSPEIGNRVPRPSPACIQIWSLRPTKATTHSDNPDELGGVGVTDLGETVCEMVVCLDGGPAHTIKWCPLPSHDRVSFHLHCAI